MSGRLNAGRLAPAARLESPLDRAAREAFSRRLLAAGLSRRDLIGPTKAGNDGEPVTAHDNDLFALMAALVRAGVYSLTQLEMRGLMNFAALDDSKDAADWGRA